MTNLPQLWKEALVVRLPSPFMHEYMYLEHETPSAGSWLRMWGGVKPWESKHWAMQLVRLDRLFVSFVASSFWLSQRFAAEGLGTECSEGPCH